MCVEGRNGAARGRGRLLAVHRLRKRVTSTRLPGCHLPLIVLLCLCTLGSGLSIEGAETRDPKATKQVLGEQYINCRCLDGTLGAFYPNLNPAGNDTFVIYLDGGGECTDEASCAGRAKTKLGSSTSMDDEVYMNYGVLDTRAEANPNFADANFVRVGYCSGDLFLGSRQDPTTGSELYFQGRYIVHGVLDTLSLKYGLLDAKTIVFGGESAGGIGSLALMDEMAESLRVMGSKAKFLGSIQGGYYFLNDDVYEGSNPPPSNYIPWGSKAFPDYIEFWGAEDALPAACTAKETEDPWKCILADYNFPYLSTPVFVAEAFTDKVVLPLHTGMPGVPPNLTVDEKKFTYGWSLKMSASLQKNVMDHQSPGGLFAAACWTHTSFEEGRLVQGTTHTDALAKWVRGDTVKLLDTCGTFLCNPTCPLS
ncbi:pectinacetylesterase-like protein [Chloropicon primus]|uniref:Pectin acetylesterase n=1 Tax=Chloropicon primus TaxID=1764295 RepID=A0A5B8N064_9CHLO|nr:pectinacetylesterase-like protein [Chloropicon primus]UPR04333.1 pectinacetylesterase-like protein [Chloropicon primus]|eukprot:QDZ25124.1 pectinacetylesterase-like protein [Chloropicon primus]